MHELSIAESVVSTVLERTEGRRVSLVRLRIFALERVDKAAADNAMSGLEMMGQQRESELDHD